MSRRLSILKGKYSVAISEILNNKYETVRMVAEYLPEIETLAGLAESSITNVRNPQITLNSGEAGTGVTEGKAGITVDRGTLPSYEFVFDEVTGTFRVGEVGSTVPVLTREDAPVNTGIAYWDSDTETFKTTRDIDVDSITVSGTVAGRDIAADGAKLDLITPGASANQTPSEIKTAYESNPDTNAYTDAEKTLVDAAVALNTTATTLPTAINELKSALGGTGLISSGDYTSANYISAATSLVDADNMLDTVLKTVSDAVTAHTSRVDNPHSVTKTQVGLGNVPDVDTTNASNISTGTLSVDRLPTIISSNTTGNANTASTLATPRTITLSGDVAGLATFDGNNDIDIVVGSTGSSNYETVIHLPNNGSTVVWTKVGELRGGNGSSTLAFFIKNVSNKHVVGSQELKVLIAQAGADKRVDVYSLGGCSVAKVEVGYVEVDAFDFDVYLKRDQHSPCSVVGQKGALNGTFGNFVEVTTEPTGITYASPQVIFSVDRDTGEAGCSISATRGVFAGGATDNNKNTMDYITIGVPGTAIDFGDLTLSRAALAGVSSSTRGVFGGGHVTSVVSTMDYITIATAGNATYFGDLTVPRVSLAGVSSIARGVFGGGHVTGAVNTMDYITIATAGNAGDFGDLSLARVNLAGVSSQTRGVFAGGYTSIGRANTMDYISITTAGNAGDFGDLTLGRSGLAGVSSQTRAVFGGGHVTSVVNTMDYITIATAGNATDFADLTLARVNLAGVSSQTRGVFAGGHAGGSASRMDHITISTTANAADFGDLTLARSDLAGAEGS